MAKFISLLLNIHRYTLSAWHIRADQHCQMQFHFLSCRKNFFLWLGNDVTLSAKSHLWQVSQPCFLFGCVGFSGGKAETQPSDLSEACGSMQDDKVTAFRPVMKR